LRVVARRLREEEQHDFRERQDPVEVDAVQDVVPLAPRVHKPRARQQAQVLGEAGLADPDQRRELLGRARAGDDQLLDAQDVDDVLRREPRLAAGEDKRRGLDNRRWSPRVDAYVQAAPGPTSGGLRRTARGHRAMLRRRAAAEGCYTMVSVLGGSGSRIALLAGVIILCAVGVVRVAPAHPVPQAARAPSKCISGESGTHNGRSIFPELRRLRVRVWSTGIFWPSIAPTRPANPTSPDDPAYQWPVELDRSFNQARANGIESVAWVLGFPAWSNGGKDNRWAPEDPKDFAKFMTAAVRRYPQVRRWILLPEPTSSLNFMPQGGKGRRAPRLYAQLLDAAYGSMHAARRNVVVIGGNMHPYGYNDEFTTAPDRFLRYMVLPNGRRPRLDMFGINPYTQRPLNMALSHHARGVDFNDLDWLLKQLDRYWPKRHLQVFIDEFGWNTEHESLGWLYVVSRRKQAEKIARSFRLAARLGRINTMCSFLLFDTPSAKQDGKFINWTSGLRTWNGVRKPAWRVFGRLPRGPSRVG
jgi:hypothetical protein